MQSKYGELALLVSLAHTFMVFPFIGQWKA
jgi:hypothetical protein